MKPSSARTLVDKIWDEHVIRHLPGGSDLLHVDRFFLHDLTGVVTMPEFQQKGRRILSPGLNFGVTDHAVSTAPSRNHDQTTHSLKFVAGMRKAMSGTGLRHFDVGDERQGIVHVIGPELGLTLPGATVLCTDSHTCSHGALGALAWGLGSTDAAHILATQSIVADRPPSMRIRMEGRLSTGVCAKDLILAAIGRYGSGMCAGYAVEFAGSAISAMSIEERLTICNMAVEFGARTGVIAPDDTTYSYLEGREYAPRGEAFDSAVAHWRSYFSDEDAVFSHDIVIDAGDVSPQATWGTGVDQVIPIDGVIPFPLAYADERHRQAAADALGYMGVAPGERIAGLAIQHVFIGSCTNGRLSDLQSAAAVLAGRKVAPGVRAWVVPGSTAVKRAAEAEGLDKVFMEAGFEWRESGCSLCSAANGETVPAGERAVSTSNRNYVGRQGPGARTHLVSPATAAASAIAGRIADPRKAA